VQWWEWALVVGLAVVVFAGVRTAALRRARREVERRRGERGVDGRRPEGRGNGGGRGDRA
jgi:hypothetical protein